MLNSAVSEEYSMLWRNAEDGIIPFWLGTRQLFGLERKARKRERKAPADLRQWYGGREVNGMDK
jgi:hypothetical protein